MEVVNLLVFHARTGGDLDDGSFRNDEFDGVFFATSAVAASTYAEHAFMVEYGDDDGNYEEDLLNAGLVVFPVRITFENTAVLDRRMLKEIGFRLGVEISSLNTFVDHFEDSCTEERQQVFAWLRSSEFDSAYLPMDAMPIYPCGDHCLRESYVSFNPSSQVRFALSATGENGCNWSSAKDKEQDGRAVDFSDVVEDEEEFVPPAS
jgi:hypothetical protein